MEKVISANDLSRNERTTGPRGRPWGTPTTTDAPIKKMFYNHSVRWVQLLLTDPVMGLNEYSPKLINHT